MIWLLISWNWCVDLVKFNWKTVLFRDKGYFRLYSLGEGRGMASYEGLMGLRWPLKVALNKLLLKIICTNFTLDCIAPVVWNEKYYYHYVLFDVEYVLYVGNSFIFVFLRNSNLKLKSNQIELFNWENCAALRRCGFDGFFPPENARFPHAR